MINITKENITNLYEIELSAEANQSFNVTLDNISFEFVIQTFSNDITTISVYKEGEACCLYAPISLYNVNLIYFSDFTKGAIFFNANPKLENPTYNDFGNDLRLYYGSF